MRWDRIIAYITLAAVVFCGMIIYQDFFAKEAAEPGNAFVLGNTDANIEQAAQPPGPDQPVVCLDAGHGGRDNGADYNGKLEKVQTLAFANQVKHYLETAGVYVVMTRTADITAELEERTETCNRAKSSAMVSIHRNYYQQDLSVNGVEAWIYSGQPQDSMQLASGILAELERSAGCQNRGVKAGSIENANEDYYINTHSTCASCILELGFMTSRKDDAIVENRMDVAARAVADGIISFLRAEGYSLKG